MGNAAWVVTDTGFEKAEIVDVGPNFRRLKMLECKRAGRDLVLHGRDDGGEFSPSILRIG